MGIVTQLSGSQMCYDCSSDFGDVDAADAVLARHFSTLNHRVPMKVITDLPCKKSQKIDKFDENPGDDTMILIQADTVLDGGPHGVSHSRPEPLEMTPSTIDLIMTKDCINTPVNASSRRRRTQNSNLSNDVDNAIRYLDTFKLSSETNNAVKQGSSESSSPIGKENVSGNFSSTKGSFTFANRSTKQERHVLSNNSNFLSISSEEISQVPDLRSIFRDTPKGAVPASIALANSLHSSIHHSFAKEVSFLDSPYFSGPAMESSVTNLISSMCLEHSQKKDAEIDLAFLAKIRDKVEELLHATRKEREATHEWVESVRNSVDKWVHEQRLLIQCERRHARERAAELRRQKMNKDEVLTLQDTIQHQKKQIEHLKFLLIGKGAGRVLPMKTPCNMPLHRGKQSNESSFFAAVEELESPTLPHLGRTDLVRQKREYAALVDGRRLVKFRNGTEREYLPDGTIITRYTNGDVKTQGLESVVYWHAKEETKQTVHNDGLQVYEYPNKQIEQHFPDGSKKVIFPNGAQRFLKSDKKA